MNNKMVNEEIDQMEILEAQLRQTYNPVKPAPEFIEALQHRLITPPRVLLENRRNGLVFVIMTLGLVLGIVLFMLIRAVYNLFTEENKTH
jgi:hypothetical protein